MNTPEALANSHGLKHFKADMLPKDKLIEVAKLQAKGGVVTMAGDGVNNAHVLAMMISSVSVITKVLRLRKYSND